MKRVSLALCSLVAALTLPAYAGERATRPSAPSAGSAAPPPSARPGAEQPLVAEVLILHATNEQEGHRSAHRQAARARQISLFQLRQLPSPRSRAPAAEEGRTAELEAAQRSHACKCACWTSSGPTPCACRPASTARAARNSCRCLEVKAHVGQAFIVAGQSHKKGILVLVIRVVK